MATDFFERQTTARRNTLWLVVMFALAIIGTVGSTILVTAVAVSGMKEYRDDGRQKPYPYHLPIGAGGAALALIAFGSLYKVGQLRGGGTVVAERLGGRRVFPNTTDLVERRVLNVVEEMALASGMPVPPVFMLPDEKGVNAFAAGFSPSDAVVAVTRGCAEQLTRDQLQGVIAHEFSHILNGDMRMNIRLIGVLHGILLLALVGRELVFALRHVRGSSDGKGAALPLVLLAVGVSMLLLGLIGSLFGNLIKAAVSRQREYLADASAVQFTRNPEGIAGALKRIGAAIFGSKLQHRNAAEASHMYFAMGVSGGFMSLFATHPPLPKRIIALDPVWDGKFPPARAVAVAEEAEDVAAFAGAAAAAHTVPVEVVENASDQVGQPTELHRQYVRKLVDSMPPELVDAAHEPYGSRAVIYATLLDRNESIRQKQLRTLEENALPDVYQLTLKLVNSVDNLDVRARLPLLDMTLPALRSMTASQYKVFSQCFVALVKADERVALFEWALHQILLRHLRPQFEPVRPSRTLYYGYQRLSQPCSVLLSALAWSSGGSADQVQQAIDDAASHLPQVKVRLMPSEQCRLTDLHHAVQELAKVAPKHRERLIDACAAAICADEQVKSAEAELLRAICDMLNCPMPPLLPGQKVAPMPASSRRQPSPA